MSTTETRGGFVEGLENIDLTAPVSEGGCCGSSGESEGCCGEPGVAEGTTATAGCCGESAPTGGKSSGCCGSDGCC